jgi:hypothetical protein
MIATLSYYSSESENNLIIRAKARRKGYITWTYDRGLVRDIGYITLSICSVQFLFVQQVEVLSCLKIYEQHLGDDCGRDPPLSIPNREVKPTSAENTGNPGR